MESEKFLNWTKNDMVEINLIQSYHKIWELLTRIGIKSRNSKTLYQSCHIYEDKKTGKYYLVHFKELFGLYNKPVEITLHDVNRRNTIIEKLIEWGMITLVNEDSIKGTFNNADISIIKIKEKPEWNLVTKFFAHEP